MARYAEGTKVTVSSSKEELDRLLHKKGADQIATFSSRDMAAVQFTIRKRMIRFRINIPPLDAFRLDRNGYTRTDAEAERCRAQEERRLWRVLILWVKGAFEMVEEEIMDFDQAFMMQMVLPDGSTVGEHVGPAIEQAYETGMMPSDLLDGFGGLLPAGPRALPAAAVQ